MSIGGFVEQMLALSCTFRWDIIHNSLLIWSHFGVGPKSDLDVQLIGLMTYNFSTNEQNKCFIRLGGKACHGLLKLIWPIFKL